MHPETAIVRLVEGNRRFAEGSASVADRTPGKREQLARDGQSPFAVVLTCADSRVPPEMIFDAGLGELFVIRNAGNVLNDFVIGSIEYAVAHLGVQLVLILGHTDCGAVTATVDACSLNSDAESPHIECIIDTIRPAVVATENDCVDTAARINVERNVADLKEKEPIVKPLVQSAKLKIAGAIYDLETGVVRFI